MSDGSTSDPPLTSFEGVAYCHVPGDEPVRLDKLVTTDGEDDRWNSPGEPTVYLATDLPIALAELARRLDRSNGERTRRQLIGLTLEVDGLLDLRHADVRVRAGAPAAMEEFRDRAVARSVAGRLRGRAACCGLLVPSMAFLDDPARGNLVLFMEHYEGGLEPLIRGQREAGIVELEPADEG